MKSFITTVKQTFQVGKNDMLGHAVFEVGGGIFGVILFMIIMAADGADGTYGTIGAMMSLMLGMLFTVFVGIFSIHQDFNMAISLGKTRRQYVPAKYILLMTDCALCILVAIIFAWLEELIYPALMPGAICEFSMKGFLQNPLTIFGFVFLVPMVVMLCGAFYLRFGMKFFWVGWVLWMCMCTLLPKILNAANDEVDSVWKRIGTAMVDFFVNLDNVKGIIGILVIGGLGLFGAFKLLSKQRVTL